MDREASAPAGPDKESIDDLVGVAPESETIDDLIEMVPDEVDEDSEDSDASPVEAEGEP